MAQKPGIPKGTRDFSPAEVARRQYIISVIKHHFETFGFQPIETPSFENSETLMGKYGEEGDRLIFKILNSGDYLLFSKVMSSYFRAVYKHILLILIDENGENREVLKELQKILLSKKTIQLVIDRISKANSDYKIYNFYSKYLISAVKEEIISLIKSSYVTNDFFQEILAECNDCDPMQTRVAKDFINDLAFSTTGRWFSLINSKDLTPQISEKALRYDLTVPFARYVVQHQNDIDFPFKRYQIQPVWRADRPQKGRYREFYQCDADVVGSTSLWQEVELVQLYDNVFTSLGLQGVTIKINNRKVLSGIAEVIGAKDKLIDFTVALDKLDKIGEEGVKNEMLEKGLTAEAIQKVQPLFNFTGSTNEKLYKLSELLATSIEGMKGVEELRFICDNVLALGMGKSELDLDVTLARGLNYYTGAIFEVTAPKEVALGSIGGGGRYDDLTGIFGLKNMSGVGISFGLDRIYLVLEQLNLFPETVTESTKVLFVNFGNNEALYALQGVTALRRAGIKAEMYPDAAKIAKQFQHADKRAIPYVVLAGIDEMLRKVYILKNLGTGQQEPLDINALIKQLQNV